MPTVSLTPTLRKTYEDLFATCTADAAWHGEIDRVIALLRENQGRYQSVSDETAVPWHVVGVLHCMEASMRFDRHLHNGDPLTGRTVHVPANRPTAGVPPFTWEASAQDALRYTGVARWTDWSVAGTLYRLEWYNGFGYRAHHPEVLTPYLCSFSCHYKQGKFVADGSCSPTPKSRQCGAAVLLRRCPERGLVQ